MLTNKTENGMIKKYSAREDTYKYNRYLICKLVIKHQEKTYTNLYFFVPKQYKKINEKYLKNMLTSRTKSSKIQNVRSKS